MTFAILNTKTEYSFLESAVRLDAYIERARTLGYETIGICDEENLHAAYRFVKKAEAAGLQPVVGFSASFFVDNVPVPLTFIALNTIGYHHLLRISTRKNEGLTEFSELADLLDGLAVVVPAVYENLAGLPDQTYVGVSLRENLPASTITRPQLAFPLVTMLDADDTEILQVFQAVREGGTIADDSIAEVNDVLQRPDVYARYYSEHAAEALENLSVLVSGIHYELTESLELPHFDQTRDAEDLLRLSAEAGLEKRQLTADSYHERLNHELSVIHEMGFDDYFLIVADLLRYAHENDIYCGMGRGSAAGSLVAYALEITQVDPVANDLLFERFLNPERVAMPDIDIDMPDNRRSELLAYMKNRYGSEHVAQIVTYSTFGKRQALRDVGKAYGLTEPEVNGLTSGISRFGTLTDEYEKNQRFKAEILRDSRLQRIFQVAKKIEGMPRQTGTHASGVVLSEKPLYDYTPLKPGEDLALTQFEAPDIEVIGLLKIDFLGLRNLSLIDDLRALVAKYHQRNIDPLMIDLEDTETLALFAAGNTLGIFQFENPQMRRFLRNLAPTKFDDIVNATSIFRPGPSQFIPQFIARRHGKEAVIIIDGSLTDILSPTYGIMIYQEQVMLVAVRFAGFSMGRADSLRRAISKKKAGEFEKFREEFIAGSVAKGHTTVKAEEIYDLIVRFANYGFNRSHAYAYAALAFQIAYYKAHFSDEFYEVSLRSYKRETMLADAMENGYSVAAPDINQMPYHDKLSNGQIYLGLSHIAGFPRDFALWIIENRPFVDLADFVKRVPAQWQKAELISSLIEVGVFDKSEPNRGLLLANLQNLIDYTQTIQLDLFGKTALRFSYESAADRTTPERYEAERQLMGVSITPHPLNDWEKKLSGTFTPLSALTERQQATILVEITSLRALMTKKNDRMAFAEVTDTREPLTVVFFPEAYRQNYQYLERRALVLITGRTELREETLQLQATKVVPLEASDEKLWLSVADAANNAKIAAVLKRFPGAHEVILHDESNKLTQQLNVYVEKSEQLMKQLSQLTKRAIFHE